MTFSFSKINIFEQIHNIFKECKPCFKYCKMASTKKFNRFLRICDICDAKIYSHPQHIAHQQLHLQCKLCGYQGEHLKNHCLEQHGNEKDCMLCDDKPKCLRKHLDKVHFREIFICPYDGCDKSYLQNQSLSKHIQTAHLKAYDYVCGECGKAFAHRNNYNYHIQSHTRKREKQGKTKSPSYALFCYSCNTPFSRLFDYFNHVLKTHQEHIQLGSLQFQTENEQLSYVESVVIEEINEEHESLMEGVEQTFSISRDVSRCVSPLSLFAQRQYI
eukprot:NODE_665_length_4905_cov_0.461506.p3 type:complete len:273 gc:universal NODE_665_length_4905_cov_0.461506:2380-1562(-)